MKQAAEKRKCLGLRRQSRLECMLLVLVFYVECMACKWMPVPM